MTFDSQNMLKMSFAGEAPSSNLWDNLESITHMTVQSDK